MDPVLGVAEKYVDQGNRYGYGQILLVAAVCLTRKLNWDSWLLRRIARGVFHASAALLDAFRQEGKEPMICSEFVFRAYDEALPEKDDPYSLAIESQADGRLKRGFSLLKRRRREPERSVPTVHPESLIGTMMAKGETPETLIAAAAKMSSPVSAPDHDLDRFIQAYVEEPVDAMSPSLPTSTAVADVSQDELLDSARSLIARLSEAAERKAALSQRLLGIPRAEVDAAPQTLADVAADFVTPGDLWKSSSLKTVGMIHPRQ
jgi:hypothetical protein